jgi:hypothetical protein
MSSAPLDCTTVTDRLIEGERPAADPQLAEHVGSCLTCFRTANDLKGLPQLRRQMLDAESQGADPGAAFWATFPAQISAAWEAKRAEAEAQAAAETAAKVVPSWRDRATAAWGATRAWLRLPVPAALGGALCAAAIIVVAMRPWTTAAERHGSALSPRAGESAAGTTTNRGTSAAAANAEGQAAAFAPAVGNLMPGGAMDDSLKEMDVESLWALHNGLERTMVDDVRARGATDVDDGDGSNSTALSDELDELNDTGLAALSQNLEGT